jgi:iron-sulfur cluster assembly accessory protein
MSTSCKDKKKIKKAVVKNEVNKKKKAETLKNIFFMTDNAIKRIDELKQNDKNIFIRVMIVSGGCAGKQYYILMDDYIGEMDYILTKNRKKYVVIDEESLQFVKNSTIDFKDSLEFSGFTIDNPNIQATCNCGNSFSCSDCFVSKKEGCTN